MDTKQVIVVRKDLNMRKGKVAAQAAHAAMMFLINRDTSADPHVITTRLSEHEVGWVRGQFTKVVVGIGSEHELRKLVHDARRAGIEVNEVIDSGRTEFKGVPTLTCAAFGPAPADAIDVFTGGLPLL